MMSGSSSAWWLLAPVFMIACMVMMGRMMGHGHGHGAHVRRGGRSGLGDAERILGERFARGEIDTDEYERRRAVLRATTGADGPADAPQHRTVH